MEGYGVTANEEELNCVSHHEIESAAPAAGVVLADGVGGYGGFGGPTRTPLEIERHARQRRAVLRLEPKWVIGSVRNTRQPPHIEKETARSGAS